MVPAGSAKSRFGSFRIALPLDNSGYHGKQQIAIMAKVAGMGSNLRA
jgi:hypothetical protein